MYAILYPVSTYSQRIIGYRKRYEMFQKLLLPDSPRVLFPEWMQSCLVRVIALDATPIFLKDLAFLLQHSANSKSDKLLSSRISTLITTLSLIQWEQ